MRILCILLLFCLPGWATAQSMSADESRLRSLHAQLLQAHIEGDVEAWIAVESDSFYVSANGGQITFPDAEARRAGREAYLREATFSIYRDLREPLVRISDDGTLGWLLAEVEIEGTRPDGAGGRATFHDIWAWIELYEKTDDGWRLIGNVSNKR